METRETSPGRTTTHFVCGYRGWGKTTFANDLSRGNLARWRLDDTGRSLASQARGLPVVALADALKDEWYLIHQPTEFTRGEFDDWKDQPLGCCGGLTVRQSLVNFATEQLRREGGDYYCRRVWDLYHDRSFIVSDWRRLDEFNYFRARGDVICWRVIRPGQSPPPPAEVIEHELDDFRDQVVIEVVWREINHPVNELTTARNGPSAGHRPTSLVSGASGDSNPRRRR